MRASRVGTFEQRFNSRYKIDDETGCWNWQGPKNPKGYGRIAGVVIGDVRYTPKEAAMLAHRASWILHNGPIPESSLAHGHVVMHVCDNPACVNPLHLRLGTQAENVRDMVQKGRKVAGAWQKATGINHFRSAFKNQSDIDLICSTQGNTSELARKFGVNRSTINRIRRVHRKPDGRCNT